MTKAILRLSVAAIAATAFLASCAKLPEQSKYIPSNAVLVVDLNTKQLSNKLVSGGLSFDKLVTVAHKGDTTHEATTTKALKDAEGSGIDLTDHFFASVISNTEDQSKSYVSMVGSLADATKFEAFLKANSAAVNVLKGSDFSYIWLASQHTAIGWNKSTVISVTALDASKFTSLYGNTPMSGFSGDDQDVIDSSLGTPPAPVDTLQNFWATELERLFHLNDTSRATNIPSFKNLLKQSADLSMWMNPSTLYSGKYFSMLPGNFRKLVADSYTTASLTFEDGKIVVDGASYVNKDLAAILKKYDKTNIDEDMLKNYPSKNVNGFIAYGFDFHIIGDLITAAGVDGLANAGLQSFGLTLSDVLNAFKGQLVAVSSDLTVAKKPSEWDSTVMRTDVQSKWLFSIKVGDKAAFTKIMNLDPVKMVFEKQGNKYVAVQPSMLKGMSTDINDEHITIGSDSLLLQQYASGKSTDGIEGRLLSKAKGNTAAGYINFERILSAVPDTEVPEEAKSILADAKNLLKEATFVASPISSGDVAKSEAVITFKDEKKNSLAQLVSFGLNAYGAYNNYQEKEKAKWAPASDSAAVTEDVIADTAVAIVPAPVKKHHK